MLEIFLNIFKNVQGQNGSKFFKPDLTLRFFAKC